MSPPSHLTKGVVGSTEKKFRVLGERACSGSWGGRGVGDGSDGGERAFSHLDAYFVPWFYGHGPEAVRFVGCDVEGF